MEEEEEEEEGGTRPISCVSKNAPGCSDSTGARGLSGSAALGPLGGVGSCSPWQQDPTVVTPW